MSEKPLIQQAIEGLQSYSDALQATHTLYRQMIESDVRYLSLVSELIEAGHTNQALQRLKDVINSNQEFLHRSDELQVSLDAELFLIKEQHKQDVDRLKNQGHRHKP